MQFHSLQPFHLFAWKLANLINTYKQTYLNHEPIIEVVDTIFPKSLLFYKKFKFFFQDENISS